MARTLHGVEIHSTQTAQYHVKLFITADGYAEAFAGNVPQEAHDKGFAWLQTLPELPAEFADSPAASSPTVVAATDVANAP